MTDNILLQITVRRKPDGGLEASVDKYPENALEHLGTLNLVMLACKQTIDQFSAELGFADGQKDLT